MSFLYTGVLAMAGTCTRSGRTQVLVSSSLWGTRRKPKVCTMGRLRSRPYHSPLHRYRKEIPSTTGDPNPYKGALEVCPLPDSILLASPLTFMEGVTLEVPRDRLHNHRGKKVVRPHGSHHLAVTPNSRAMSTTAPCNADNRSSSPLQLVSVASKEIATVYPTLLWFPQPFDLNTVVHVHLRNNSKDALQFKVKCTAPNSYCVRPRTGFIESGKVVRIAILFQPLTDAEHAHRSHDASEDGQLNAPGSIRDRHHKDKFLIQCGIASSNTVHPKAPKVSDSFPVVWSHRLHCSFDALDEVSAEMLSAFEMKETDDCLVVNMQEYSTSPPSSPHSFSMPGTPKSPLPSHSSGRSRSRSSSSTAVTALDIEALLRELANTKIKADEWRDRCRNLENVILQKDELISDLKTRLGYGNPTL